MSTETNEQRIYRQSNCLWHQREVRPTWVKQVSESHFTCSFCGVSQHEAAGLPPPSQTMAQIAKGFYGS